MDSAGTIPPPSSQEPPRRLASRPPTDSNHITTENLGHPTSDNHVHLAGLQADPGPLPPPPPVRSSGAQRSPGRPRFPAAATVPPPTDRGPPAVVGGGTEEAQRQSPAASLSRNGSTGTQEVCISRSSSIGSELVTQSMTQTTQAPIRNHSGPSPNLPGHNPLANQVHRKSPLPNSASSLLNAEFLETLS